MLSSLIAPPSTPRPARRWAFGMFVLYTFWAFLLVMLPFSNDDTLREAGWPLIAAVSLLSPILAGLSTCYALQKTARPPDDLRLGGTDLLWADPYGPQPQSNSLNTSSTSTMYLNLMPIGLSLNIFWNWYLPNTGANLLSDKVKFLICCEPLVKYLNFSQYALLIE